MKISKFIILMMLLCFSSAAYAMGVRLISAEWVTGGTAIPMNVSGNLLTVNLPKFYYAGNARFPNPVLIIPFRGCYRGPTGRIDGTRNPHGAVATPVTISVSGWANYVKPLSGVTRNGGDGCLSGSVLIPRERLQRNTLPRRVSIVLHGPGRNITLPFQINPPQPVAGSSPILRRFNNSHRRNPPK